MNRILFSALSAISCGAKTFGCGYAAMHPLRLINRRAREAATTRKWPERIIRPTEEWRR
jgi:hypothetical protein